MKKIIYLLFLTLFVFTSCNQEDETIDVTIKSKQDKVTICHKGKIITVNGNALNAHLKHGDIQLIDADGDGWVEFENDCVPGGDCNDLDPLINPGVEEICGNNIDDDCDGDIDEDCRTYVPDDSFEKYLISLGYDDVLDDYVLTTNINSVTEFNIPSVDSYGHGNISDLTGIEDFIALEKCQILYNNISSLDFSMNTNLRELFLNLGGLTELNLTNNVNLEVLEVSTNLTNLDLTKNTALIQLASFDGQFTNLDLSNNTLLKYLTISRSYNLFTNLDLSNNTLLKELSINRSQLINLNIKNGNNGIITNFGSRNNPNLTCIQVDDASYSTANWTNTDPWASFSEDCGY